jgi:cell division protein FtsA
MLVEVADGPATLWGWDEAPSCIDAGLPRLLLTCEEMLARAEEMALARVERWPLTDQMMVGLPASQLHGGSWSVTQRRTYPQRPVEEQELRILLGRALRLAMNQLESSAPAAKSPDQDSSIGLALTGSEWRLVDATAVAVRVDGKLVTDPVGFRGCEISATVFAALARAGTIEIWRRVARELEFSALILTAVPLALVAGQAEPQGILLDVGGATTGLTLWRAGRPLAVGFLPVGGATLTSALIRAWGLSPEKAEQLKWAYASGQLADDDKTQVLEAMFPALRSWLDRTEIALAGLCPDYDLPARLFLFGGGSGLPEMMEAAHALAWSEGLHFERYPQVERLRPTDISGVVNRTDFGRGAGDVAALALAAWAGRQSGSLNRPALILRDLCEGQCSG